MDSEKRIKSVAIIGAGAAGAVTAAAFKAENYFERIQVFERRETAGGTWIYDATSWPSAIPRPGSLPPESDPPLNIPNNLPQITPPAGQERFSQTPIYNSLTTNVPDIAMCFSDARFAYGPFVPHWIPRQYVESYFALHKTDSFLVLNTTVESVARFSPTLRSGPDKWKLTLRKRDSVRHVDIWWEEVFDAVVIANGHYSVPYIPHVPGLEDFTRKFPGRVVHSKSYRVPIIYSSKKVLVIGNATSGHDLAAELVSYARLPLYQSRRSKSRWDGDRPPRGIEWKPIVKKYELNGRVVFDDDTYLDDVDTVIYCTGYKASFPFWDAKTNGRPLYDYKSGKLIRGYWHTFFQDFPTLGIVGLPRSLTFRSFEYQAIALARLFSDRNSLPLPPLEEQESWEREREEETKRERRKFHDIPWESGETMAWLEGLFRIAGLGTLKGEGRIPPVLGKDLIWALEHLSKHPIPGKGKDGDQDSDNGKAEGDWVLVERQEGPGLDSLDF